MNEEIEEDNKIRSVTQRDLIKKLNIGQRASVTFITKFDDDYKLVSCEPYSLVGEISDLSSHGGYNEVSILFDGDDKPTSAFKPSDIKIIL